MRIVRFLLLTVLLISAVILSAQTPQSARLRGRVLDSTGAVMVGADVKVSLPNSNEALREVKTNDSGDFDITVPLGEYNVAISAPDFESHIEVVRLVSNMRPLSVSLSLAGLTTTVDASDDANAVAVSADPDQSLTAQTISGDAVRDLLQIHLNLLPEAIKGLRWIENP